MERGARQAECDLEHCIRALGVEAFGKKSRIGIRIRWGISSISNCITNLPLRTGWNGSVLLSFFSSPCLSHDKGLCCIYK